MTNTALAWGVALAWPVAVAAVAPPAAVITFSGTFDRACELNQSCQPVNIALQPVGLEVPFAPIMLVDQNSEFEGPFLKGLLRVQGVRGDDLATTQYLPQLLPMLGPNPISETQFNAAPFHRTFGEQDPSQAVIRRASTDSPGPDNVLESGGLAWSVSIFRAWEIGTSFASIDASHTELLAFDTTEQPAPESARDPSGSFASWVTTPWTEDQLWTFVQGLHTSGARFQVQGTIGGVDYFGNARIVSIQPIPEPSSYALMLVGMALVAAAAGTLRRR